MKNRISDPWKIVENNLGIVATVIKNRIDTDESKVGFEFDDLFQEGCIWLYKAVITFDDSRGVKFNTYASKVVSNGLYMYCNNLNRHQIVTVSSLDLTDFSEVTAQNFISSGKLLEEYIEMLDILDWLESLKSEYKGITKLGIEAIQWKVKGLRVCDIARIYGVKSNLVGAWSSRALKKIRDNPVFNIYMEEIIDSKS